MKNEKKDPKTTGGRAGMLGTRYGGAPLETSPRVEKETPSGFNWRAWRGKDHYGYTIRLSPSGDGWRIHLRCVDDHGREGHLDSRERASHNPPQGTTVVSYGGGFLDPQKARELAKALLAYADEKDPR